MRGIGPYGVFVDANVWYSRTLRDWFGLLYVTPDNHPFVVYWTEDVLAELLFHLRKKHPEWSGDRISGIRDQLVGTFSTGRVASFTVDSSYRGADLDDAHVHSATLACAADVLVTFNHKDFVWDENTSEYEVMSPDAFLVLVDDGNPSLVASVVEQMCTYWVDRSGSAHLPAALRKAKCPEFADRVVGHLQRAM